MSVSGGEAGVCRLVTFLGRGRFDKGLCQYVYDPTTYELAGTRAPKTRYVCHALAELLRPSDICILATDEAESGHGTALKEALRAANCPAPRFVRIPIGREPRELWQQFDVIKTELRGADGPVMLDITHGFRSQPFFAASVVTFVHAVDQMPPDLRVCYAAHEAKDPDTGVAPIWELSEFVALLDWSRALAMFLKTGRAEEAAALTGRRGSESEPLRRLSETMKAFSLDLQTLRTGNLLIEKNGTQSSAIRLLEAAQSARNDASSHLPPLAEVLNDVVEMVEPIASNRQDLSGPCGHRAVSALAHLYLKIGRYLEAAVMIREGRINKFASPKALRPGASDFNRRHRQKAEDAAAKSNANSETDELRAIRNDMSHAQYVKSPRSASEIIRAVNCAVRAFSEDNHSQQHTEGVSASDQRSGCFVNLSNHPSSKWNEAQTKAALALAERIKDIAFPAVPPDADEKAIAALAEECVAKVPPETSHALVQGEFTLTVELVRRLQARGVTCLAATSKRDVEESGDGRRVSTFTFVRFRAYSELRPE